MSKKDDYLIIEENLRQFRKMGIIGKIWKRVEKVWDNEVVIYYVEIVTDHTKYKVEGYTDGIECLESMMIKSSEILITDATKFLVRSITRAENKDGLEEVE